MKLDIKLIISGVLIIAAMAGVFLLWQSSNDVVVDTGVRIISSPSDTLVRINGDIIELNDSNSFELSPGNYSADVIKLNFSTKKVDFTVENGQITDVPVLLEPVNDQGEQILREENEILLREEVSYLVSLQASQILETNNDITRYLPARDRYFRIDYGVSEKNPDDPTKVAIYITTDFVEDRELALDWIRGKGIDPASLEIYYRFFEDNL